MAGRWKDARADCYCGTRVEGMGSKKVVGLKRGVGEVNEWAAKPARRRDHGW